MTISKYPSIEVLKQISPKASPGAPQEVPTNTAPSSSTSSAGTAAGFDVAARIFSAILLKASVLFRDSLIFVSRAPGSLPSLRLRTLAKARSAPRQRPQKKRSRLGRERLQAHKMKFAHRTLPVSRYRPLKVVFEHKAPC